MRLGTGMKFICFLLSSSAKLSLQAPPKPFAAKDTYFSKDSPLLHLIKSRPPEKRTPAGKDFRWAFSQHSEVMKFETLSGQDFIDHAIELRKKTVENEHGKIKAKFRSALDAYMEDHKGLTDELKTTVKSRLKQIAKKQNEDKHMAKQRATNLLGYRKKRNLYNARRRQNEKERKPVFGTLSPFEESIKGLNLPKDANAADIERRSRHIIVDSNHYTAAQLKKYLRKRFDPLQVKNAMPTRAYTTTLKASAVDYRTNGPRGKRRAAKKQKIDPSNGQSSKSVAISSPHGQQEHHQISSSHQSAIEARSPSPILVNPDQDIDPLGTHFHPTEWWKDLYKD